LTKTKEIIIIKGLDDLVEWLRSIGFTVTKPTLKKYIEKGLPHWYDFGAYHFHTENVLNYFKGMCMQTRRGEVPEEKNEV